MLKSIIRSTCLMALATLSLAEVAPALAADGECGTCASCCTRTRACEYRPREVSLTAPQPLIPQGDAPVILVDPPAVQTPVSPPETVPFRPAPRRRFRGRG